MASKGLKWCESAFRGEGILVDGRINSGSHATLTAALRVDVPYEGEATEKRHVLVLASYSIDGDFPVEAELVIDISPVLTTESVIRRWKQGLSVASIWRLEDDREFRIRGTRGNSWVGLARPYVIMHCSAMMAMATGIAWKESEDSHLRIAAQRLAYRLQDRLNKAAMAFDEQVGG